MEARRARPVPTGDHAASGARRSSGSGRPLLAIAYDINCAAPMGLAAILEDLCDIVWVIDGADPSLGSMPRLLARLGTVFDTAGAEVDRVAGELRDAGIDGAIAFSDTRLATATAVARSLDLECNPPDVVARLNDKRLQREALAAGGIETPASCRIPGGADGALAAELAGHLRYPVVVKPRFGDSSREVRAVPEPDILRRLFDGRSTTLERLGDGRAVEEEFVVEEYLPDRLGSGHPSLGGYVSVETIVQRGEPTPLSVTGKFALAEPFRETGNFMPHLLDTEEAAAVLALSVDAARALGVRTGVLHTEIKLTPDGPRVIEVNGRVGGGGIDALHERRHGVSLTELAARLALGEHLDLEPEAPRRWSGPFLYEYFVQPPRWARRLGTIRGSERILGVAGADAVAVNRSPGDELDWRRGSQGYVVRVSGEVADRSEVGSIPDAVWRAADIEFDAGPVPRAS